MDSATPTAASVSTSIDIGPTAKAERVLAPDLIRGAALLLIPLGNVGYYLWGRTAGYGSPPAGSVVERVVDVAVQLFFVVGVPVFAITVGWGLATTARRLTERGVPRRRALATLVRRNLALLGLGLVHVAFLFSAEVLSLYGIAGMVSLLLIHRSRRVLLVWATVGTVLMVCAYALIGTLLPTEGASEVPAGSADYVTSIGERFGVWFGDVAFLVITGLLLAPFIIGFWFARSGLLDRPVDHIEPLRRLALVGIAVNILGGLPAALVLASVWTPPARVIIVAAAMYGLAGLAGGVGFVSLAALIAARIEARRRAVPAAIAAVGERSLSCYLLQSLMLAPLLAPWGLGLGGRVTDLQAYGIAVAVALVNVAIAVTLARVGARGPIEAIIRRLIYRRAVTT